MQSALSTFGFVELQRSQVSAMMSLAERSRMMVDEEEEDWAEDGRSKRARGRRKR
jgi:hypothetical protein